MDMSVNNADFPGKKTFEIITCASNLCKDRQPFLPTGLILLIVLLCTFYSNSSLPNLFNENVETMSLHSRNLFFQKVKYP